MTPKQHRQPYGDCIESGTMQVTKGARDDDDDDDDDNEEEE
jgi:hypothetical protein